MCLMGAHQQKFLHQHKLQQNANIMYENLFSTTKINFSDFHGGGSWLPKENSHLKKSHVVLRNQLGIESNQINMKNVQTHAFQKRI